MRIVALMSLGLLGLSACQTTTPKVEADEFERPNDIMAKEIEERIAEIPFQRREELVDNLMWLAERGEASISALLTGLENDDPKVRSNCVWVLGRIQDRRTMPYLRPLTEDQDESVRLEAARQLVSMGDLQFAPVLIEGLDSDKTQVRYYCHEALKSATGRDFDYDHLSADALARTEAVYRWRSWWSEQSGDPVFAQNYAEQNGLEVQQPSGSETQPAMPGGQPAAPGGEVAPDWLRRGGDAAPQAETETTGNTEGVGTPAGETQPGGSTPPSTGSTTPPAGTGNDG